MVPMPKIVSIVVLFATTSICSLIPCCIVRYVAQNKRKGKKFKFITCLLNCFTGGVFLGVSLLGLLPEALEKTSDFLESAHINTNYPISEIIIAGGLIMILLLEHAVGMCLMRYAAKQSDRKVCLQQVTLVKRNGEPVSFSQEKNETKDEEIIMEATENMTAEQRLESGPRQNNEQEDMIVDATSMSKLRGVVLLLALSFHSTFDGLALGLQSSHSKVWALLLALCLHKTVVSASLGLHLEETFKSMKYIIACLIGFSLVSPTGVAIGIAITETGGDQNAQLGASAILQSLATGTFLYVTFFEILQKELSNEHSLIRVFMTIIGFAVIGGLEYIQEGD